MSKRTILQAERGDIIKDIKDYSNEGLITEYRMTQIRIIVDSVKGFFNEDNYKLIEELKEEILNRMDK